MGHTCKLNDVANSPFIAYGELLLAGCSLQLAARCSYNGGATSVANAAAATVGASAATNKFGVISIIRALIDAIF